MILQYLKQHYDTHLASVGGTLFSLFNGQTIANSVAVGLILFVATNLLKKLYPKLFK